MKVLVTTEQLQRPVPGGVGTYVRGLANGLRQQEFEFDVFAAKAPTVEQQGMVTGDSRVRVSGLPARYLTKVWDYGLGSASNEYDVVHSTSLAMMPKGKSRSTVLVHDLAWRSHPEAFPTSGRLWHEQAFARVMRRADAIMVPSGDVADAVVACGRNAADVFVVGEGCDHLAEPNFAAIDSKLQAVGLEGDFILSVGTLEPRKNLQRLVAAFLEMRARYNKPISLVVVGPEGWGNDGLTKGAEDKGIFLLGRATDEELSAYYQRCKAFAFVPLLEGFGLPAVEAMSMGAPVVSSAVPSVGHAAHIVDPLDVTSIANGLHEVMTGLTLREHLVDAGKTRSATMTWRRCAQAHIEVWESLK